MKNLIVFFLLLCGTTVVAQKTEAELVRSAFQLEKKALVADYLQMSNDEAEKFWPIYNQYEAQRIDAFTRRFKLIDTYLVNIEKGIAEVHADEMVKESAAIQKMELELRQKYYKLIKKSISLPVAARFYQVEDAINVAVRNELYGNLPVAVRK
ncbi:MAG: hypothetical protein ACK47E_16385 [Cyclobacteriaceae bacterium]|jgi:hypothetical protein